MPISGCPHRDEEDRSERDVKPPGEEPVEPADPRQKLHAIYPSAKAKGPEKHVQVVPRVVEDEEQLAHGGNQPGYRRATLSLSPEFYPQRVNESRGRSK